MRVRGLPAVSRTLRHCSLGALLGFELRKAALQAVLSVVLLGLILVQ